LGKSYGENQAADYQYLPSSSTCRKVFKCTCFFVEKDSSQSNKGNVSNAESLIMLTETELRNPQIWQRDKVKQAHMSNCGSENFKAQKKWSATWNKYSLCRENKGIEM
jgi:hypothetical protein